MEAPDDGNQGPLWDGNEERRPIRKPHSGTQAAVITDTSRDRDTDKTTTINTDALIKTSKLSVDAKEFVPVKRTQVHTQQHQHHYSAQNRLRAVRSETNVDRPRPDNFVESNVNFQRMKEMIIGVTYNPGQFEDIIEPFMEEFGYYTSDVAMITAVADFLFRHGVEQASFRYNGARLSSVIRLDCPIFEEHLLLLCEQESDSPRPGFVLFLAELFIQHDVYASILYKSITKLLSFGTDENVKTVCQALKLSGRALEQCNKEKMDAVFEKLTTSQYAVTDSIVNLLDSVIKLRSTHWGISPSAPSSSHEQNGFSWDYVPPVEEKPAFYCPDGLELSADEQKFLATEYGDSYFDDSEDADDLYDPEPEMDEEIRAGFREFTRLNRSSNK